MTRTRRPVPNPTLAARGPARYAALALTAACSGGAAASEPLATCELVSLPRVRPAMAQIGFIPTAPTAADGLSTYRKDMFGDWPIAEEIDADDPNIDLVLATPSKPIHVRVSVWLAGAPFRSVREGWIDAALSPAKELPETQPGTDSDSTPEPELDVGREAMTPRFESTPAADWLAMYTRASPEPIDRTEARWLLAQRAGGPAVIELAPSTTPRTAASPLRDLLDLDGDGGLNRPEIEGAADVLARCDFNEDGDVDRDEVLRATPPTPQRGGWRPARLLRVQDAERDVAAEPELVFQVRFGESDAGPAVRLVECESSADHSVRSGGTAIAATLGGADIEFSAAGGGNGGQLGCGQLSVGAVIEGEPLWSRVDTNHDYRLSQRELSLVAATLRTLDVDGDSVVAEAEFPTRVRVAVATGANVHALLSAPATPPPPATSAPRERAPAPEWFASMDANSDGDLSPAEFLGGRQQFAGLDVDGDGLISASEAAAIE